MDGLRDLCDGSPETITERFERRLDLANVRSMIDIEQAVHDGVADPELVREGDFRHVAFQHGVVECGLGSEER